MSRSKPENRAEFIGFCLRKLGEPVIKVNVADVQIDDSVDQAIEYFQRNHYDGSMQMILLVEVTQDVKDRGYFKVDDSILGITRIIETDSTTTATGNDVMLTDEWQIAASAARELHGCVGCSPCNNSLGRYASAMQQQDLAKWMFGGKQTPIQWSRHTDRLYIVGNNAMMKVGNLIAIEVVRVLPPDEFPQVWNDPFLKKYCTALIKEQWGNNLRKMRNIPLAGGITLQGEEILAEAKDEIAALEENMQTEWQEPPMPMIG